MSENGYELQKVQPVDLFPQTPHVETVVQLINQNAMAKHHVKIGVDAEDYYKIKDSEKK
jgi:23S rRNA (uracil1939-C5)-methyltransferase